MDKVLKQRLIGASILIALAVIFIPMLFDAPDDERPRRETTIDLPEPAGERAPVRRIPRELDQARRPDPEPERGVAEATSERPVTQPLIDEPIVDSPAEAEPASAIEQTISLLPDTPPAPEPESEPEPAPSQPAVAQPATGTESGAGWLVQVASFGSEVTATDVVERLRDLGHVASIEPLVRGDSHLHRVRTGPYGSREDAERARGQIERTVAGIDPVVIGQASTTGKPAPRGQGYAVQVGSFASRDNAVRLLGQLEEEGFEAFIHEDAAGSRTIWRVRVGPPGTRDDAVLLLDEINQRAGLEGLVVSHP